jgi:Fur family transcriptional regulator, ferric uptake regulator
MRKTKVFLAIETIFNDDNCNPLDYSDILERLHDVGLFPNKTTVFRILDKMLLDESIVQLELGESKYRYERNQRTHHHHAVCTICGRVAKVSTCDLEPLDKKLRASLGFKTLEHRLEFFGKCITCN